MDTGDPNNYRRVIIAIHEKWFNGKGFAIWEVRDAAAVSSSTARRVITDLMDLRLVHKRQKSYLGRKYHVTSRWPIDQQGVVDAYELNKIIKMGA